MKELGGYPETLTLHTKVLAMANETCRRCDRDAGAYCSSCAVKIMARALDPFYGGRRKKSPWPEPAKPPAPPKQHRLFR